MTMTALDRLQHLHDQRGELALRVQDGDASSVDGLAHVEAQIETVRREDERRVAVAQARARRDATVRERERASLVQQLRDLPPRFEAQYAAALADLDRRPRQGVQPWELLDRAYRAGRLLYSLQHDIWAATSATRQTAPVWFVPNDLGLRSGERFVMSIAGAPPKIVKDWQPILDQLQELTKETPPAA